jgi:ATP-binding cassette subfamily B protein/subfamily B ATP-binding cassette protein MsbA
MNQFRLFRYVWPHRRQLAVTILTMAVLVGLDVLRPWPLKLLVDQVVGGQPLPGALGRWAAGVPGLAEGTGLLAAVCAATVVIFLARSLVGMVNAAASVTFGQRMVYALGDDLFRHLQRLSLIFHSRRSLGDMVGRVTVDTYCLQVLLSSAILPLLQSVLTLVTMFFVMWRLEPTMTLVSMAVVPFLVLLMWSFSRPMKVHSRRHRDLEGRMMSLVEQTLGAMPAVQAFGREDHSSDRFRRNADDAVTAYRSSLSVDLWFKMLVGLVTTLGTAGIMWLGARYAQEGRVSAGDILIFLTYLASLYEPLNSVVYTASVVQHASANADRVLEVMDVPVDVTDAPGARDVTLQGHVLYEDVTFGYDRTTVLRGVSLEARPGEVVAIVGPTGAGKTTLVNLLLRFFDPWSGRVTVDGHDLRDLRVGSLRRQISIVLQDSYLFPMTVAENLAYGRPTATPAEIEAAARAANADEFIRRLPDGYDTVIGERGATLSGGEKQRLAIARALLKDAPILVLDEPTSALDARTEGMLLEALDRLMAGRTTFIIAHRLSTIRSADRILVIDDGSVVEQGRHEDLLLRGGLYAQLYRQQMNVTRHDSQSQPSEDTPALAESTDATTAARG